MENFARLRNLLKKEHPTVKVSVRRVKLKDFHGKWEKLSNGTYIIKIRKQDTQSVQMDTLIHEWAHVLTDGVVSEHTVAWGIEYAKLYQLYEAKILT